MHTVSPTLEPAICPLGPDQLYEVLDYRYAMINESGYTSVLNSDWRELTHQFYKAEFEQSRCQHFGAFVEGRLVGISGALIRTHFPFFAHKNPTGGWIMDVYVEVPFRGRGLATRLTKAAITWLKNQGVQDIRLVASAQAKQLKIYEKLGFAFTNDMKLG